MAKSTLPRCKAGYTRSKKTGNCEPKGSSSNKTRSVSPKPASPKKAATQRCPRGCVKDRKTKLCVSKSGGPCGAASRKSSSSHRKSSSSHRKSSSSHRKMPTPPRAKTPSPIRAKTPSSPKQHVENQTAARFAQQIAPNVRGDLRTAIEFQDIPKGSLRKNLLAVLNLLTQVTARDQSNYKDMQVHTAAGKSITVQALTKYQAIEGAMMESSSFLSADDISRLANSERIPASASPVYAMVLIAMRAVSEYMA